MSAPEKKNEYVLSGLHGFHSVDEEYFREPKWRFALRCVLIAATVWAFMYAMLAGLPLLFAK